MRRERLHGGPRANPPIPQDKTVCKDKIVKTNCWENVSDVTVMKAENCTAFVKNQGTQRDDLRLVHIRVCRHSNVDGLSCDLCRGGRDTYEESKSLMGSG